MNTIAKVTFDDRKKEMTIEADANLNESVFSFKTDKTYSYSSLESYEYIENHTSIAKGKAGGAIIGRLLFGTTGAVIGSAGKKYTDNVIEDIGVRFNVRVNGAIKMEYITINRYSSAIKYGSLIHQKCYNTAQQLIEKLDQISISSKKCAENQRKVVYEEKKSTQYDIKLKEQLKQIKELFDEGLLDEQEYKEEKRILLQSIKKIV